VLIRSTGVASSSLRNARPLSRTWANFTPAFNARLPQADNDIVEVTYSLAKKAASMPLFVIVDADEALPYDPKVKTANCDYEHVNFGKGALWAKARIVLGLS